MIRATLGVGLVLVLLVLTGCGKKLPPDTRPPLPAPPPPVSSGPSTTPAPEALPIPPEPVAIKEDTVSGRTLSLDDLNRNSPFKPVYFQLDSAELDDEARAVVTANAGVLRKNATWMITVEGHCDERGTAEYNLALGERRAVAVRTYLMSLGVAVDRVRVVSYGKEFPFDPGHDEKAWSSNRRAHFVITSN